MEGRCEIHPFEPAENACSECLREYCHECLVYPFGPKKPPLCVACALSRAGIRKNARRPRAATNPARPKPKVDVDGSKGSERAERKGLFGIFRRKKEPAERELVVRPLPIDEALKEPENGGIDWSSPVDSGRGH
ncbi:MAG: hypothetical protein KatS3mg008_1474 [Acidimicrobiales bacterium]|nr:MAG: hypothetical protein KatS3mg008_1474 [Acidimicrobiales bacterium]